MGMIYGGSIIVPLARRSWVIKVICVERGITGMRETVLLEKLLSEGLDPPTVMAKVKDQVDDPLLDADWPDHPLTKVRRTLDQVVASIVLAPEVGDEQHLAPGW